MSTFGSKLFWFFRSEWWIPTLGMLVLLTNSHISIAQNVQGAAVISRIPLTSRLWKNHCQYWNKRHLSRKPLISALIWHPESGRGIIMRLPHPHRRQEVKNPPRGPMLFAARGRGAVLMMPLPFLGRQIKAEIKGFLLMYSMFLY